MPGGRGDGVQEIVEAVRSGKIEETELNEVVDRILDIAFKGKKEENLTKKYDQEKHHQVAQKIAEESVVLLKNDESILPLNKEKIALIGDMAKMPRYQGAGSSTINPYKIENAISNFEENNIEFEYAKGYEKIESPQDEELKQEAIEVAKRNKKVVLFIGLTENYESEGVDRTTLELPENQNKLVDEICKVNPSGKLAETYPIKIEDIPCYKNYPGTELTVEYQEAIYVGYRYYDKNNVKVLFPFGFGLSYTKFEYSNLNVKQKGNKIELSFKIKNIGDIKGKEIVQIYIKQDEPVIFKPEKELKAFEKIELEQNEEKEIYIILDKSAFKYYNTETKKWSIEKGKYNILVGKSSQEIVLQEEIQLESDDENVEEYYSEVYRSGNILEVKDKDFEKVLGYKIPSRHLKLEEITDENTLEQIKETKVGKVIYENQINKMNKLLNEQNVNKATKVMMDLQKPLKKFYKKKSSKITKEMVEELLSIAKNNEGYENCEFLKVYLK